MIRLAVIVVSYNVCDLLRRCLSSVERAAVDQSDQLFVDIIVVDNQSRDGSAAMVRSEFPAVQLAALDTNLGFTGGNNLGLHLAGFAVSPPAVLSPGPLFSTPPDYALLLNPDTEVELDALRQMVDFMERTPNAGGCGAQLRFGDGRFQHGAFRFPTLAQILIDFYPLTGLPGAHRLHDSRLNGRYAAALWAGDRPFPVDFVLGAAVMVRGAAVRQVGGLDDGYFMYCEEMDWCRRLQTAGWRVYAVPAARVIHHAGQSSRQAPWTNFVRLWRSRFRFYAQHKALYPPGYGAAVRMVVRAALVERRARARRRFGRGELDGTALAEELSAYAAVMAM